MSDEYSAFGGLGKAMQAFSAFPMDGRMRRLLLDGADYIVQLEAALREIAAGLMPEDSAADQHNRYELCAARLCGIARRAITSQREKEHG